MYKWIERASQVALVGALLLTLYAALSPDSVEPDLTPWDKATHFVCFFVLTTLSVVSFPRLGLAWIATSLSAFGAAIEIIQSFVGRDAALGDWVADTAAVLAVVVIILSGYFRSRCQSLRPGRPQTFDHDDAKCSDNGSRLSVPSRDRVRAIGVD